MIKTGRIEFYDRPTAWGLIVGDDQDLYVVRGRDGRGAAPRVGERVVVRAAVRHRRQARDGSAAGEPRPHAARARVGAGRGQAPPMISGTTANPRVRMDSSTRNWRRRSADRRSLSVASARSRRSP